MPNNLKKQVEKMKIKENLKETASALVSDVKEITNAMENAAGDALDQVRKNTDEVFHKVDKKLS